MPESDAFATMSVFPIMSKLRKGNIKIKAIFSENITFSLTQYNFDKPMMTFRCKKIDENTFEETS